MGPRRTRPQLALHPHQFPRRLARGRPPPRSHRGHPRRRHPRGSSHPHPHHPRPALRGHHPLGPNRESPRRHAPAGRFHQRRPRDRVLPRLPHHHQRQPARPRVLPEARLDTRRGPSRSHGPRPTPESRDSPRRHERHPAPRRDRTRARDLTAAQLRIDRPGTREACAPVVTLPARVGHRPIGQSARSVRGARAPRPLRAGGRAFLTTTNDNLRVPVFALEARSDARCHSSGRAGPRPHCRSMRAPPGPARTAWSLGIRPGMLICCGARAAARSGGRPARRQLVAGARKASPVPIGAVPGRDAPGRVPAFVRVDRLSDDGDGPPASGPRSQVRPRRARGSGAWAQRSPGASGWSGRTGSPSGRCRRAG